MKDLKFEQSHPMTVIEAAEVLEELAKAMRSGGVAELSLITGVLTLRIPDELWAEVEWEVGDGKIELEIEFSWPAGTSREASAPAAASPEKPAKPARAEKSARSRKAAPAKRARSGAGGGAKAKRTAAKKAPAKKV
ncbi:amphi-Trp domain-containing protein [Streptomyces sp. P9(2023)]|uniref:amphi-Trp domain-containing protein n=1 Tax=Streptomyces sp. P9(2023) TaxID=3064394 RepID=UPI0028F3FBC3|nr:amphi-Trp domain-containing protein [Streptomyces sp. P9(2023)]MDT9690344.1 amphi-Trp domain-containing protein [Streptomyces sp. P9(2023)]